METDGKLVIIGAGETAAIAYEYFTMIRRSASAVFVLKGSTSKRIPFSGFLLSRWMKSSVFSLSPEFSAFVAISSTQLNRLRIRLFRAVKEMGYVCPSYISSRAFVWHNVEIGENCFIFENNTVQPFVKIGDNVVIWSGTHIGHNTTIRDNCFISSHVVISGFCDIGENCFLGVNSTVINNITIAKDCFIGAGALIQNDTEEGRFYKTAGAVASRVGSLQRFNIRE
jgi:sugar O-acyltransferase (sialic acid O-acetyltransferase NeuD family)